MNCLHFHDNCSIGELCLQDITNCWWLLLFDSRLSPMSTVESSLTLWQFVVQVENTTLETDIVRWMRMQETWKWQKAERSWSSGFKPPPQISHLSPLLKSNILSGVHLWFRVSSMHVRNITTEWTDGDLLYALLRMLKMNNVIPSEWSMETNVRNEQRSILICKVEDWVRAHES